MLASIAAAQEDAEALFAAATRLHDGLEVPQNHGRAEALYRQAAEKGHVGAQHQLGKYLFVGLAGGEANAEEAVVWLRRAAESGDPEHIYDLARALETLGQVGEAAQRYRVAAEAGHAEAAVSLGVMYQNGSGVAQDFSAAKALYDGPASQDSARALNNLGLLYVRGDGVAQDYGQAAAYFQKAAELGSQQAMTNLGVLYDNGFGVEQSDELAATWYQRGGRGAQSGDHAPVFDARLIPVPTEPAARNALRKTLDSQARSGDPVAEFLVGWLSLEEGDAAAAARWFDRAAQNGHAPSMTNLARLYFLGQGVLQDYVQAQMWVTLAMTSGQPEADGMARRFGIVLTQDQMRSAQLEAEKRWGVRVDR